MTWLTNPYRFGGGGIVASPDWRVRVLAAETNAAAYIAEVVFAASNGGAPLATSGTPIANSGTAADAFDGSTGPWVGTNGSKRYVDAWVGMAYTSPVLPVWLGIRAASPSGGTARLIILERRIDGVNWLPVSVYYASEWTAGAWQWFQIVQQDFTNDIANARAWRANVTAIVSGEYCGATEIIFAGTIGGATLCSGGYGFGGPNWDTGGQQGVANEAFDGGAGVGWYANHSGTPIPMIVGYGRAEPFAAVPAEMRWNPNGNGDEKVVAMTVQWSTDFVTWNDKASFSSITGWSNGTAKSFVL